MMKNGRLKGGILVLMVIAVVLFSWSCGGGGRDGSSNTNSNSSPTALTPAGMDQEAAEHVAAMSMVSADISDFSGAWADDFVYARAAGSQRLKAISLGDWAYDRVKEAFRSGTVRNAQDQSRSGSYTDTDACLSGTAKISGTWTGPNEPDDACEVSDATMTMTFSNCQESNESIDGVITVKISGNLCSPTAMSVAFNSLSLTEGDSSVQVDSEDFQMKMTELQWSSSGDELTHVKATLNGDIAMNSFAVEFYHYVENTTINGSNQTITISGSLTGSCLDGWVTLTTLSPIVTDGSSECPVGGSIRLSGTSDVIITCHSDGSMDIGETQYACQDLPDACQ
jgi:hypothetical protein